MKKSKELVHKVKESTHDAGCKRVVFPHRGTGSVDATTLTGQEVIEVWKCVPRCPVLKVAGENTRICGILILM